MSNHQKFDLEERTAIFGVNIIRLCKSIKLNIVTEPIIKQLIRSATSIGANYMEANGGSSKKDFKNKIHITKKETLETKHWLRMLAEATIEHKENIRLLWKEANELSLIFHKITSTLSKNMDI